MTGDSVLCSQFVLRIASVSPTSLVRWQPVESGRGACDSEGSICGMDVNTRPFVDRFTTGTLGFPPKVLVLFICLP